MGAPRQSRGGRRLCEEFATRIQPRKLLWEHESQIRLYRLASLSYSTPDTYIYIYIHVTKSSLRISFYPVQRNTPVPPPSFVESENPSSKMRAENFKGLERCSRITRYSCNIYFCLDIIPVMKLFPGDGAPTSFHFSREIFERC